jgi:YEATS family
VADVAALASALAWPVLIAMALLWLRPEVKRFFGAVASRVERGDSLEASTSGLKLAADPAHKPQLPAPAEAVAAAEVVDIPHSLYLLHRARRDPKIDKNDHEYYRLRVWLDADDPEEFATIAQVTYHLHPSFADPTRVVGDPGSNFELRTVAWGQFMLTATVQFKSGRAALVLERYLNF